MLGTHQTQDEWVQRQTGGAFTAQELDALLGLQSQVIRQHGTIEIEYNKAAAPLEPWADQTLPIVRDKLLALFGWISDGQREYPCKLMAGSLPPCSPRRQRNKCPAAG